MRHTLLGGIAAAAIPFAVLFVGSGVFAAEAEDGKCQGSDMVAEMRSEDPGLYEKIMAEAAATENSGALLWKIGREGRPASYLFGTVHLTDERVTTLSPAVQRALGEAKAIALEVSDLSDNATTSFFARAAPLVMFSDDRRLDAMLSPAEYDTVKKIIARSGMPVDLAASFRPWIISMILSVSECERQKVQQGARVLDMKIAEIGKAQGIPVYGLETISEQLGALAAVPEAQQLDMLRASLHYADRTNDLMETLVQLYLDRRISAAIPFELALARKAGIGEEAFTGFQQKLLSDRNENMRSAAEPLLEHGGTFVAVGALHLPGKLGLVSLFRQAGYTLTPIE